MAAKSASAFAYPSGRASLKLACGSVDNTWYVSRAGASNRTASAYAQIAVIATASDARMPSISARRPTRSKAAAAAR